MELTATTRLDPAGPHNGRHRALRALSTVAVAGLCVVAALAVAVAVATRLSPRGQYTAFGHPVMTVVSGSMTPVIGTGDLIVDNPVSATQASRLRVGQVISFRDAPGSQRVFTHRIVAVRVSHGRVSYITKGDANNAADFSARPASDVIGVFRFAIPAGGYVLAALHHRIVLGLLLASFVLWMLARPLIGFGRKRRKPEREHPPQITAHSNPNGVHA